MKTKTAQTLDNFIFKLPVESKKKIRNTEKDKQKYFKQKLSLFFNET